MNWDLFTILTFVIILTVVRGRYKQRDPSVSGSSMTQGDQMSLSRASDTAQRLEQRVETLERLLDEDAPGWRARVRT